MVLQKRLGSDDFTAVDVNDLARDKAAVSGSQQHVSRGYFAGLTRTLEQHVLSKGTHFFRFKGGGSGVQMGPGATPLTRIFRLARGWASERVKATMAPLVEA